MRIAALWLLLLCSCAALNTAGMSPACKSNYEACLNGCPDAPRLGAGAPPPTAVQSDINPEIASCTDACNRQARSCK